MIVTGSLNCQLEIPPILKYILTKPIPQNFSLPSGIIHYITHTPSASDPSQKLLQTCKYFVFKKFILAVGNFYVKEESNDMMLDYLTKFNALSENLLYKLWLKRSLSVVVDSDIMNRLLNNVYKCKLMDILIANQSFSFNDYLLLVEGGIIKEISLYNVVITYSNGKMVPFEDLMERVPTVAEIKCSYTETPHSAFTSKTAEKLITLPAFEKLKYFKIYDNYPKLNAENFCDFIKKTGSTYSMTFRSRIDEEWFKIFETSFKDSDYIVKKKDFDGILPFSKSNNLHHLITIEIKKEKRSNNN